MPVLHGQKTRWEAQEILNLVSLDLNGDGFPDVLDVNLAGATNPIPVTIVSGGGITQNVFDYGTAVIVPANTVTTIKTHTVTGSTLFVTGWTASGEVDAEYQFFINASKVLTWRTSEQQRNAFVPFPNIVRSVVGTIFDIKVLHFYPGKVSDFDATLIGYR